MASTVTDSAGTVTFSWSTYSDGNDVGDAVVPLVYLAGVLITNGMYIICFARVSALRTPGNSFLLNLAISDIMSASGGMPLLAADVLDKKIALSLTRTDCLLRLCITSWPLLNSHTFLVVGAVERYVAVEHPFRHSQLFSKKMIVAASSFVWVYSGILAMLPLLGVSKAGYAYCDPVKLFYFGYIVLQQIHFWGYFLVLVMIYTKIFLTARAQSRRIHAVVPTETSQEEEVISRCRSAQSCCHGIKAARTMVFVVGTFFLLVTPFQVTLLLRAIIEYSGHPPAYAVDGVYRASIVPVYALGCFNPLIYSLTMPALRAAIKDMFCCCCKRFRRINNSRMTVNTTVT